VELREIGCEGVDWINLAQDRSQWLGFMSMVTNFQDKKTGEQFLDQLRVLPASQKGVCSKGGSLFVAG
jgi:hypothetical protein